MGKIRIILNPIAGKGKAAKQQPEIERFLKESGRDFEVILTKKTGDASDIVRNLPLKTDDITVAAGGDGTCNEVVNGLLKRDPAAEPPILGILPVGRGNDFSSTPKIPGNLKKALEILLTGNIKPLDAGLIKGGFFPHGRYFINGIGIGFDTKVGFEAAKMKITSGLSYFLGAFIVLVRYEKSPIIRIIYEGNDVTVPAILISIVNGRRMGGSFYMGPDALIDDGQLDICYTLHQESRLTLLNILSNYTKGTQSRCDGVFTGRSSHFRLIAEEGGMACHCDGETVCFDGKELEISCLPGALRLIGV